MIKGIIILVVFIVVAIIIISHIVKKLDNETPMKKRTDKINNNHSLQHNKYEIKDSTLIKDIIPYQTMQALCTEEFSILVQNKFTASDTLVFLKHFLLYSSKCIENGKIYYSRFVDGIINDLNELVNVEFGYDGLSLYCNEQERTEYCEKLFLRHVDVDTHVINTEELLRVFVQILLYDKNAKEYVDYNDNTPTKIVGIDEVFKYTVIANSFFGNISKTMVRLYKATEEIQKNTED